MAQVEGVAGTTFTGCSDTYGVTWTQFTAGQGVWSNSNLGVTNVPQTAYWAKTGAHSGAETVTCTTSAAGNVTYGLSSWAASDVNVTAATPEDASVFRQDTNANTCTSPSPVSGTYSLSVTNDVVLSMIGFNSVFDLPSQTSTSGPVQQSFIAEEGAGSNGAIEGFANFSGSFSGSTGTLAPLAIQSSVHTTWTWGSCTSTAGNAGIYTVALKGPLVAPTQQPAPYIINYRPQPARHRPLVLAWILPLGWPWRGRRASGWPRQEGST